MTKRICPKNNNINEGSLACEECDHWVIDSVIITDSPMMPPMIPYAIQKCDLFGEPKNG